MIERQTLLLRPIKIDDSVQIFTYRSDSETNKYQGFIPENLEKVEHFITNNPLEFNLNNSWFQLVIIEISSKQIIGDIGVHFIGNDGFQCELGCTILKRHQGKGYATTAMKAIIDYLFETLKKHRIIASVDPNNVNSIKLLERLNFRKEAHFRESLFINGVWVDDIIYGLLKDESKL